jgi:hypothetical protein
MANEWLRYANQGATRSQPLSPQLVQALSFLNDMGMSMDVFSGGQPATGLARVGSHRHDNGGSADVFFNKGGRRLDWANPNDVPIFQDVVRRAKAAGVTGFGAGPGYMQPGSMHIGFGTPAVWGARGSKANAPSWLQEAYGGAPLGRSPQMATAPGPQMASAAPTSATAGMMTPGPTAAPQMFGDLIGQNQVATTAVGPMDFGQVAANLLNSAQERDRAKAETDAAETARRVALFGGADGSGLWGLYA